MTEEPDDDGARCGVDGRRLTHGWTLCQRCSDGLLADLTEITTRYRRLDAHPSGQQSEKTRKPKPGSRPPLRLDVVALRDYRTKPEPGSGDIPAIPRELDSYASQLAHDQGYQHRPEPTVDDLAEFLGRQAEVIARWDYGPDLCKSVRKMRNVLRAKTGEPNPKPSAWCVRFVDEQGSECGAPIFWNPDSTPSTVDGLPGVRCAGAPDGTRHAYTGADLLRLAAITHERGKEGA